MPLSEESPHPFENKKSKRNWNRGATNSPHHIIRLKRSGGVPMPLAVVILPKVEKSQQVFIEHKLLGLATRVEVQKNARRIG
nr:unnamed protein product [Callosobruchus chinensis]